MIMLTDHVTFLDEEMAILCWVWNTKRLKLK